MGSLQFATSVFTMFYTTTMIALTSLQLMGLNEASSLSNTDALPNAHYFFYQNSEYPKDCKDVRRQCSSQNSSGVYLIKPDGFREPFEVFCDNDIESGGWTVIQRREDGILNFNRNWTHYRDGFGFLSTEYFIGNEKLAYLTNQADYELLIEAELEDGCSFYTSYKGFRITDEFGQYTLQHVGSFDSNGSLCLSDCPATEFFVNGCTERCSCNNNRLKTCSAASCDDNAVCDISGGVERCSCNNGYEGDGITCRLETTTSPPTTAQPLHRDCQDVYDNMSTDDGVYSIVPNGWTGQPFNVYCDMSNGGGWTVFQRRRDDTQSFYQTWDSYKEGFGDLNANFWLGNEKLYYLTNQKDYELRLDITTSDGTPRYAEYAEFQIESEGTNYRMNKLGTRSTTDGGYVGNNLCYSRGKEFSTHDRDNDACGNFNCADLHRSGWWHSNSYCSSCWISAYFYYIQYSSSCRSTCTFDNLNGVYNGGNGEKIYSGGDSSGSGSCSGGFTSGLCSHSRNYCDPQLVEMKIRPSS